MATRLRRFSRSKILKFVAFALVVLLISQGVILTYYAYSSNLDWETLFVKDYDQSETFQHKRRNIVNDLVFYIEDSGGIELEHDYFYYFINGSEITNNVPLDEILDKNHLYQYDEGDLAYMADVYSQDDVIIDENCSLYIAFSQEYMQQKQQEWKDIRFKSISVVILMIQAIVVAIICIIYLIMVTGRNPEDDEVHLSIYMDRIYNDIKLCIILFALFLWLLGINNQWINNGYYQGGMDLNTEQITAMILFGLLTGITTIVCGVMLLSLVRNIKAMKLLKNSLIYSIFNSINKFIKSFFDDSRFEHFPLTKSLNRRQIIFTVSSVIMVFVFFILGISGSFLFGFPVLVELVIIFWYFTENNRTFKEINLGFNESLNEQMKSERMKVDLITNVSHDLKTPLTSIISYVDLLSKEDLPEASRDYVNILADKSGRLNNIVSDLFDLAKVTSGNMPLNIENLDLKKLIEQTLGDMEDEIEKSSIRIKTDLTESPVYINSDGKKLYRVFQNIIGNALKYSLQGTRVFIEMELEQSIIYVTVKNTASYDMDFSTTDILQRFNRGDKSRTTEGSGLGLSIAESFTWACGGTFKVDIDGDQFKVKLAFALSE